MKIRIINSSKEISRLDPKERVVHVSFPLTTSALLELAKKCPKLEGIQVPPSRLANMGGRSLILLEVLGVRIFEGSIQGYRTDRAEYITIDDGLILQRAGELRAEGWTPGRSWRKWLRRRGSRRGWWGSSWIRGLRPSPLR
ncbi:DUF1699 family protein [Methanothrix harundinacea]|jgi:hypothetical protein|uniref:DUF1699 family protein n=1 Tax=Methanothrix harundinacea TaxID=301375 RepID=UPI00064FDD5B|nr:DUF1699 family protein [Methanothrix harundinacea]